MPRLDDRWAYTVGTSVMKGTYRVPCLLFSRPRALRNTTRIRSTGDYVLTSRVPEPCQPRLIARRANDLELRPSNPDLKLTSQTFIDLFAGCGGFSLGLMQAGWKGLFAVERDSDAFK